MFAVMIIMLLIQTKICVYLHKINKNTIKKYLIQKLKSKKDFIKHMRQRIMEYLPL